MCRQQFTYAELCARLRVSAMLESKFNTKLSYRRSSCAVMLGMDTAMAVIRLCAETKLEYAQMKFIRKAAL